MTDTAHDDPCDLNVVKSLVGQALLRVQRSLREATERQNRMDALLATLHQSWDRGRRRIERRLQVIERQLDDVEAEPIREPRLTIVGHAPMKEPCVA